MPSVTNGGLVRHGRCAGLRTRGLAARLPAAHPRGLAVCPRCRAPTEAWPPACSARRVGRPCLPHVQGRADAPDARAGLAVGVPATPGQRGARVFSRHDS
jgi:hypothetical protein